MYECFHKDSIERQEAIDAIRHIKFKTKIKCFVGIELHIDAIQEFFRRFLDEQERVLKDLPSVELERKKGKWNMFYDEDCPQDGIWTCSACGYIRLAVDDITPTNFCPNCGAEMQKGEEDDG